MNLQIQLQFLGLDQHKVSAVELHPIKPWVATANDLGVVKLWDYESQKLVHRFSITDLDDQEKEGQALQQSLERDPTYKGPKVTPSRPTDAKKKQIGEIRCLKFVDTEVQRLKRKIERLSILSDDGGPSKDNQCATAVGRITASPHMLFVLGDNRIFGFDYEAYKLLEIDMSLLDGKIQTTVEVFSQIDCIAFGGVDGTIRIWNITRWQLYSKLTGAHSKPILKMQSHHDEDGTFLIACSEDGLFSKWVLNPQGQFVLEGRAESKAGDARDFTVVPAELQAVVLTDKGVVLRDFRQNSDIAKVTKTKASISALSYYSHPRFPKNTAMALTKDGKALVVTSINTDDEPTVVFSATDFPKHDRAKILTFQVHPQHTYRIAIVTTLGVGIINMEKQCTPSFVLVPATDNVPAKIFYASKGNIYSTVVTMASEPGSGIYSAVSKLSHQSYTKLLLSPTKQFVAAIFPDEHKFQILHVKTWKISEEGSASSFAWAYTTGKDTYAIIDEKVPGSDSVSPLSKVGSKAAIKRPSQPATTTNKRPPRTLRVRTVGDKVSTTILETIEVTGDSVPEVHGGALLGLGSRAESQLLETDTTSNTFQFYTWAGDKVGPSIPLPVSVSWEPAAHYCLLIYEDYFCLFTGSTVIKMIAKVSDVVTSSIWFHQTLFYTNLSADVKAFFPHSYDCQDTLLSTVTNDVYDLMGSVSHDTTNKGDFVGSVSLVEMNKDSLIVIDAEFKMSTIRVSDSLTKFFCLAHVGYVDRAMKWVPFIPKKEHPRLARFLEARGHAPFAMGLDIPLLEKLQIVSRAQAFDSCVEVLRQIADEFLEADADEIDSETRDAVVGAGLRAIQLATRASQNQVIGAIYSQLGRLDPSVYKQYIVSLSSAGHFDTLKTLHTDLATQELVEPAKVAAAFIDDNLLGSYLRDQQMYAEAIELFSTVDPSVLGELAQQFNDLLSAEEGVRSQVLLANDPDAAMTDRPPSPLPLV